MPSPWVALAARPDLILARLPIAEPGRYYHAERTIVVRKGMLLEEERRYLWHELVHADRQDQACHGSEQVERSVERAAARWAMPITALEWAWPRAESWAEFAGLLKIPVEWAQFRVRIAHPAERALMRRAEA